MSRYKPIKKPHRIIPVWREEIDHKKLAQALILMAQHLDEKRKTIHKKAKQKGGGSRER